ncbi:MAG: hypothetical protein HFE39_09720 [Clostridiales bacterium]|nr:hypothetical protein [Clostridiales bacterium]
MESSTLCALRFHNPDQPFYLYYKGYTKNVGWDTPVKSTDYSYAGSFSGKLQAVGISLYNSSTGQLWDNTYVMMYRAYCENYWLPWVSNATPNLMRQVQDEFNLGGVLDYSSTNAGLPGGDGAMTKFEIRIFKDNGSDAPSGGGLASGISQRYMVNGSWNTLTSGTSVSAFHGVELKTSGKPYYLYYRTYNTGHGWYPFVRSTEADYAGSSGKAIEGLQIQVYDNSGQRINQRHVVMYRAYAGGRWLSWVSNAPLSIMQMLQNRYSLGGSLDSRSYYAGLLDKGAPITKLDIRVYEYVSNSDAPGVGGLDGITQIYHANGEWHTLTPDTHVSQMDHVKFSTYGKDYYLYYQAYSAGYGWYPRVSSDGTDDAGSTGKAIEGLAIDVYSKSGEKLRDRVAVMYRAYANGRWLPWVSNADPGIMQQIHQNYHLGGTLDTAGAYAGIKGVTINRLEVRVYTGVGSLTPLPGANVTMSCAHLSGSWQNFSESYMGTVSGIKIQTPGKPYYLQYRTWNEGRTDYYPWVTSNINDYAGSLGKPVQRLQIQAYKNNGAKLTSGIVVMYRTYTNGRWLPWVSNADASSMRYVQSKYALPGALETTASYAGIPGANIGGVEIRVYEESMPSGDGQPDIPDFPDIPANGRGMKIYIDAGHGGTSPGTAWGNNIEKNYNLQISLLQEKYFKQKGFQVKMARTTDIFSTLAERSGEANAWGAHLYLSNHINAGGGKGVTTFYQYKSAESKKYATAIEQELKKVVGTSMGVRTRIEDGEDYYHVLRETRMTSVLIEHCFLDNAEDRALLNAPGALDAMAKATVNAVCSCIPDYVEPEPPIARPEIDPKSKYFLRNILYNRCLLALPGEVQLEGFSGNSNQQFTLQRQTGNYYKILYAEQSLLCSQTDHTVILSTDATSGDKLDRLLWKIEKNSDGTYCFINKWSNRYLSCSATYRPLLITEHTRSTDWQLEESILFAGFHPRYSNAGVGKKKMGNAWYYDYTNPISKFIKNCAEKCFEHRLIPLSDFVYHNEIFGQIIVFGISFKAGEYLAYQARSLLYFVEHVKTGGDWDIKWSKQWTAMFGPDVPFPSGGATFYFDGELITAADLGNLSFAYAGSALGCGQTLLHYGGGIANIAAKKYSQLGDKKSLLAAILDPETMEYPYSEPDEDIIMVDKGVKRFNENYPNMNPILDGAPDVFVPDITGLIEEFKKLLQ